jgi:tRNA 5-methylaminomethyl-2-thiouridine biosynthesis bifunctional protein
MPSTIVPATVALDGAGTPYSPQYGDIYHSAESGPGQARHVFLGGNDLPARWAGARSFTILETGFGLGLNFLATWEAWRADPSRPGRLHFVSIEKHPFTREGLETLHGRYSGLAPLAAALQAAWPLALPGLHRLELAAGSVVLTLALGDIAALLPRLRLGADAFYLDGFAPTRNPQMWTPPVMKALARLARPGATLATYTTARAVRDALATAGFQPALRPGYGPKRHMLAARFEPRRRRATVPTPRSWSERSAVVIGAGLAGAAAAERLAARGWRVEILDRRAQPAQEASAMPAGVFHANVARDDSVLARLTRAGCLYGLARWSALEAAGLPLTWARCGVLQLGRDARDEARMAATVQALGFPAEYLRYLSREEAGAHAGRELGAGGWWFPGAGWLRPDSVVAAQLAAMGVLVTFRPGTTAHALARDGDLWRVLGPDGTPIASAPVVVLANSHDAARLAPCGAPLKRVRGQLTLLPEGSVPGLRAVLAGTGHVIPAATGAAIVGATYDYEDDDAEPSEPGHAGNLERLARLMPGTALRAARPALGGAVGFRCVSADRLPLIGAMPDTVDARASVSRLPGLYGAFAYGSRGLTWAALGGELIASLIEGEPLPVESDLAEAIDPGRFLLRRARRRQH